MESYQKDSTSSTNLSGVHPNEQILLHSHNLPYPIHNMGAPVHSSFIDHKMSFYSQKPNMITPNLGNEAYYQNYCSNRMPYINSGNFTSNDSGSSLINASNINPPISPRNNLTMENLPSVATSISSSGATESVVGSSLPSLNYHRGSMVNSNGSTSTSVAAGLISTSGTSGSVSTKSNTNSMCSDIYNYSVPPQTSAVPSYSPSNQSLYQTLPNNINGVNDCTANSSGGLSKYYNGMRISGGSESTMHPFINTAERTDLPYAHFSTNHVLSQQGLNSPSSQSNHKDNSNYSYTLPQIVPENLPSGQSYSSPTSTSIPQLALNLHNLDNSNNLRKLQSQRTQLNVSSTAYGSKHMIETSIAGSNGYSKDMPVPAETLSYLKSNNLRVLHNADKDLQLPSIAQSISSVTIKSPSKTAANFGPSNQLSPQPSDLISVNSPSSQSGQQQTQQTSSLPHEQEIPCYHAQPYLMNTSSNSNYNRQILTVPLILNPCSVDYKQASPTQASSSSAPGKQQQQQHQSIQPLQTQQQQQSQQTSSSQHQKQPYLNSYVYSKSAAPGSEYFKPQPSQPSRPSENDLQSSNSSSHVLNNSSQYIPEQTSKYQYTPKPEFRYLKLQEKPLKKQKVFEASTPSNTDPSVPGPRRSLRERRAVQLSEFIVPKSYEDASLSEDNGDAADDDAIKNIQVIQGRGVQLGSIASFVQNYESMRTDTAVIRKLFRALYGTPGHPQIRKRFLFVWSGLPSNVDESYLATELARYCTVANLRDIGKKLLGLTSGANGRDMKQAWIASVVSILANPQPHVIMLSTMFDSKDSRYNMTSFQLFCSEKRPLISAERPGLSNKELMQILGAKWRMLSPAEKYKYQAMSAQRKNTGGAGRKRGRQKRNEDTSDGEDERGGDDIGYDNDVYDEMRRR